MFDCNTRIAVITTMMGNTPTVTPSSVSAERSLCAASAFIAMRKLSCSSATKPQGVMRRTVDVECFTMAIIQRRAAVSKTSRSALEVSTRWKLRTCCGCRGRHSRAPQIGESQLSFSTQSIHRTHPRGAVRGQETGDDSCTSDTPMASAATVRDICVGKNFLCQARAPRHARPMSPPNKQIAAASIKNWIRSFVASRQSLCGYRSLSCARPPRRT